LSRSSAVAALAEPLPPRSWPSALAALSVRRYRLFLSSQLIATTGLWMQRIAQDWLVLELTGSVAAVGIAVALQFLPVLLFGLFGGVLVDRYPKRRLLLITQSSAAVLALALGGLALSGTVQVWHVYLIASLLGFVTVVDNPTRQVFVAELVGDRHLANAVSLNSSVFQLGALLGPAASGILISAVGQGWSFLLNGLSCLVVVGMLVALGPSRPVPSAAAAARGQLLEGLRVIRSTSEIAWTLGLVGMISLLGFNMPVILAAFADTVFDAGVAGYSVFNSLSAVGALTGALLSARRRVGVRLRLLVALLAGLGVVLALASLAPTPWLFGAALVGQGVLALLFLTGANSLVQMATPPSLRGRVMSVYVMGMFGGQALGGPVVGHLVDTVGARVTLFGCGALIALGTTAAALVLARRSRLGLELDLHPEHGRLPLHIVPAEKANPLSPAPTMGPWRRGRTVRSTRRLRGQTTSPSRSRARSTTPRPPSSPRRRPPRSVRPSPTPRLGSPR